MTADPDAHIFRLRELELRHTTRRLSAPFKSSLAVPIGVAMFAEELLRDTTTDAVMVLHLTKRLRLLGVHRPPSLPNPEATVAEILRAALLSNAAALVYVHRRVSDGWPEDDDSALVGRLRQAARMFDVELRDAIITWSTPRQLTTYSFREDLAL